LFKPLKNIIVLIDDNKKYDFRGVIMSPKLNPKLPLLQNADVESAKKFVELDKGNCKILELPRIFESDTMTGKVSGKFRKIDLKDLKVRKKSKLILIKIKCY
jgi:hypothetical protein